MELLKRLNRVKPYGSSWDSRQSMQKQQNISGGAILSVFLMPRCGISGLRDPGDRSCNPLLPGETEEMMLDTIRYLNRSDIQGIKLQLLHILRGTDLARDYEQTPFHIPDMEEYIRMLGRCISSLNPDIVIHRLTGDGPKDLLIAPLWTGAKRTV